MHATVNKRHEMSPRTLAQLQCRKMRLLLQNALQNSTKILEILACDK